MNESDHSSENLTALGKKIVAALRQKRYPVLEIPDRRTSNIVYDENSNHYVLGPSTSTRDSSNVKHVKRFAQLTWVASFAKELLQASRTSSLRDL
ncbi:MAG: DNA topoisomerase IV subunit A, partial [Candidatus Thorarchaeota archaeon]